MRKTNMLKRILVVFVLLTVCAVSLFAQDDELPNLVTNGQFDYALDDTTFNSWVFWHNNDAEAEAVIDTTGKLSGKNSLHIINDNGGAADWSVQFIHDFPTVAGAIYEISFMVAMEGLETITFPFMLQTAEVWSKPWQTDITLSDGEVATLGPFEYVSDVDEARNQLIFKVGTFSEVEIWIDSVMVKDLMEEHQPPEYPESAVSLGKTSPESFILLQNYPNPFNPSTQISYTLAEPGKVQLDVCDTQGRIVDVLVDEKQTAGQHFVTFNARSLPSGLYFYRLRSGGHIQSNRMLLLK